MSQRVPSGRGAPRWSVEAAGTVVRQETALIAGLPDRSAMVLVPPPLSANGPSIGFRLVAKPQLVSPRLPTLSVNGVSNWQFVFPGLLATIEFLTVIRPRDKRPPPLFAAIVLWMT